MNLKLWDRPSAGEQRMREGFLWWPKLARTIGFGYDSCVELRWLEHAHWHEVYSSWNALFGYWKTIVWMDRGQYRREGDNG